MPRLSRNKSASSAEENANSAGYMPGQDGERKKKKGFLSFLSKKKSGSFKLGATSTSEPMYVHSSPEEHQLPAAPSPVSPAQSTSSRSHSSGASGNQPGIHSTQTQDVIQKQPKVVSHRQPQTNAVKNAAPTRRKRAAPAPPRPVSTRAAPPPPVPSQKAAVPAPAVEPTPAPAQVQVVPDVVPEQLVGVSVQQSQTPAQPAPAQLSLPPAEITQSVTAPTPINKLNHSRNSSHSSGFDESNISPVESPGTSMRTDVSSKTITSLDVTSVAIGRVETPQENSATVMSTTTSTTTKMTKSQSLPTGTKPAQGQTQLITSSSLNTLRRKKRKAPAPPPPSGAIKAAAPKPLPEKKPITVEGSTSAQETVEVERTPQGNTPVNTTINAETEIQSVDIKVSESPSEKPKVDETDGRIAARLTDLTKDIDDGASSSSGSLERSRGPCQFVPPPPPDSPPPPETPFSHERAKAFNFSTGGVEVVDSSIQAHVSSPCSETYRAHSSASLDTLNDITSTMAAAEYALTLDEGDLSVLSVTNTTQPDSEGVQDSDTVSDGSSVQIYEVNAVSDSLDGEEEKKDGEKDTSDEADSDDNELPAYPEDPVGIVLIKKTSTSEYLSDNLLAQQKAEKEEINERKIRSSLTDIQSETADSATMQEDHVTVVSVGGEPDAAASDSGHSSATIDKSEDNQDILENEITFEDEDVLYVDPLNPGNPIAKEEYLNQVERERMKEEKEQMLQKAVEETSKEERELEEEQEKMGEAAVVVEELNVQNVTEEDAIQCKLQEAREAAAQAAAAYESKKTPLKSPPSEGPLITSTPVVQSVSSVPSNEDSFYKPPSPVLPVAAEEVEEDVEDGESGRERKISESVSEEGDVFLNPEETMIALNDYRIAGLVKEEVIEFSFPKHSKPLEMPKKKETPSQPMVTSLRQSYAKRPVGPREPLDLPDLEVLGLLPSNKGLPPPPSEPAPPIPSEPSEPIFIKEELKHVDASEKIYIAPAQESVTDADDNLIEVSATGEPLEYDESSELSVPNEAEPETLERDKASALYRMSHKEDIVETKPVGILKASSYSESSSTSHPTKGILKASSIDHTQEDAKPAGILKNKDSSARVYSSMTSLVSDSEIRTNKPYSSFTNLVSDETNEDTQCTRPKQSYNKRGLGVYGPRPWGASKFKSNVTEEINTRFSDRYNNNDPLASPTKRPVEVQQQLDELGFSPSAERERENVLEEKSLSMMSRESSVWHSQGGLSDVDKKEANHSLDLTNKSDVRPQSTGNFEKDNVNKSLQAQYEDLQKQFNQWQKQLLDNQALLTQKNISQNSVSSSPGQRPVDARYEPPKKTKPDTGGGGRFDTNDLLAARSRLKSSQTEDDDVFEKCGITVGRIIDTKPSQYSVSNNESTSVIERVQSLPHTPAPDTSDFPPPPKRLVIGPSQSQSNRPPSRFEPKLDPREELMITIRNSGGRTGLRKVAVNETNWYSRTQSKM